MIEAKPKIIVLCGSSRFVGEMAICAWFLERDEGAIAMGLHLLPWWYPDCPSDHLAEHEGVAQAMDELHLRKIDLAARYEGEIFVVNVGHYIGDSTANEVAYAASLGVPIRWYMDDPIGRQVEEIRLAHLDKLKEIDKEPPPAVEEED